MRSKVVALITTIRNSHPDMEELYLFGQCYNFFLILRSQFPEAIPYYDTMEGHVYTKIGKYWYDIRGVHYRVSDYCQELEHRRGDKPHRWGKRDRRRLI